MMPTALPPARIVPWPNLVRVACLWVRIAGLNARMTWLPATHRQQLASAVRWLAYCEEMFRLLDMPEPEHVAEMRAMFMRPLPDGSTLLSSAPSGARAQNRTETPNSIS